jgi:hypothetical protein
MNYRVILYIFIHKNDVGIIAVFSSSSMGSHRRVDLEVLFYEVIWKPSSSSKS